MTWLIKTLIVFHLCVVDNEAWITLYLQYRRNHMSEPTLTNIYSCLTWYQTVIMCLIPECKGIPLFKDIYLIILLRWFFK